MLRAVVATISSLLFLASCTKLYSNRDLVLFSVSDFKDSRTINTIPTLFSDSLILTTRSEILNNYFIVIDQKGHKHIHVFDIKSSTYLGGFVNTGQGPGEIQMPWVTGTDEAGVFYTYDIRNRKILGWETDSLVNNSAPGIEYKFNETGITSSLAFDQSEVYYTDIINPNARFFSFNPTSRQTSHFGELPSLSREAIDINRSQAHRAIVARNKNKLVIANYLSPFFEIYDSNNKTWLSFLGPDEFEPSFAEVQNHFAATKHTKLGYLDLKTTDRYIYLLYSGDFALSQTGAMDQGRDLLIFDFNGKPIKHFQIDKPISTFSVYKDSLILGINMDIRPQILKFVVQ